MRHTQREIHRPREIKQARDKRRERERERERESVREREKERKRSSLSLISLGYRSSYVVGHTKEPEDPAHDHRETAAQAQPGRRGTETDRTTRRETEPGPQALTLRVVLRFTSALFLLMRECSNEMKKN